MLATRQGDGASSPDAAATRRAAATRVQPRAKQGPLVSCRRCVQGAGHRRAGAGLVSRDTHCRQSATRTVASGTCRMELQVHDGATRGGHAQACCCSGGRHPAVPSTRGPKEGWAGPTVSFMASPWALPFMPSTTRASTPRGGGGRRRDQQEVPGPTRRQPPRGLRAHCPQGPVSRWRRQARG